MDWKTSLLPLPLALAGCASLEARVSVFDPSQLDPIVVLLESLPRVEETVAPSRRIEAQDAFADKAKALARSFLKLPGLIDDNFSIDTFLENNEVFWRKALMDRDGHLIDATQHLARALAISPEDRGNCRAHVIGILMRAQRDYLSADSRLYEAIDQFDADLTALLSSAKARLRDSEFAALALEQVRVVRELRDWTCTSGLGFMSNTSDLVSDAQAALVAGAPDRCWKAVYNRVYGAGEWGNVDIAVIKETASGGGETSVPLFSLKGVRVDSGTVTRATFAGLKEAMRVAAVAMGVPAPQESGAAGPEGGSDSPPDAAQAQHEQTKLRQEMLGALEEWLRSGPTLYQAGATDSQKSAARQRLAGALAPLRTNSN